MFTTCTVCDLEFELTLSNTIFWEVQNEPWLNLVYIFCSCGAEFRLFTQEADEDEIMALGIAIMCVQGTDELRQAYIGVFRGYN